MQYSFLSVVLLLLWPLNGEPLTSIERDAFGVERSPRPFDLDPLLHRMIMKDLDVSSQQANRLNTNNALTMLNKDLHSNRLLRNAWNRSSILEPSFENDAVLKAAFVYSLSNTSHDPIYHDFNNAVSGFNESSQYENFNYKGLYGLLLHSIKPYHHELYRGISAKFDAAPNTFIRFNRFQSSSTNKTVALIYAKQYGDRGTLLVFRGVKNAVHVSPYSIYPNEEEYLIEPRSQFRIVEVIDVPIDENNPGRVVILESVRGQI